MVWFYIWDKVADIIVISKVGSFILGHNIDFILWDKVADTIVIINVGNCIPGHNMLKYRINWILQVSVLVELQLVVDQWANTEACSLDAHFALWLAHTVSIYHFDQSEYSRFYLDINVCWI